MGEPLVFLIDDQDVFNKCSSLIEGYDYSFEYEKSYVDILKRVTE